MCIRDSITTDLDLIDSSLTAFIDSHFEVDRVTYNIYLDRIEMCIRDSPSSATLRAILVFVNIPPRPKLDLEAWI